MTPGHTAAPTTSKPGGYDKAVYWAGENDSNRGNEGHSER
jgi:hypothetical protein